MIRPDVMQAFVNSFADAGFKASAFCPSYGLAEATLAVSMMPPGEGIRLELVEESDCRASARRLRSARAATARSSIAASRSTGMEVEIRGEDGDAAAPTARSARSGAAARA